MTGTRTRVVTIVAVVAALIATPIAWTPLAFSNGESRAAVLTTWLVIPVLPLVGAWVARSRPSNPVGWLLLLIGMAQTIGMLQGQVLARAVADGWSDTAIAWLLWTGNLLFLVGAPLFPLVLLLFPDGRPPTPRWRPAVRLAVAAPALVAIGNFAPGPVPGGEVEVANPLGIPGLGLLQIVGVAGLLLILVSAILATVSLIVRWRRATGIERLQLRWVAFAVSVSVVALLVSLPTPAGSALEVLGLLLILGGIPGAIGIAVVRYRLYDLPVVVNRTVVYGLVMGVLLAVYASLTALTVRLLEWSDTTSALTATAVVVVLFSPLRDRAQRLADRWLFGSRNDPYGALVRLGRDLESQLPTEAVPHLLAERVRQALRVPYAAVVLGDDPDVDPVHASGAPTAVTVAVPLRHRGEVVGHLVVSPRPPDDDLATADRLVLDAMAGQAGAAVQAARLHARVQTSTARRVAAVEEERRRIRRDLHDGLGPTLAGIGLGIETVARRVEQAGDHATADLLARLRDETQAAITSIRGLVYGLRPPALDELGLAGALQTALVEPGGMRVDLHVEGLTPEVRLPAAVEVAAYRIAVEAVANAARHAGATTCMVEVVNNGVLTVAVTDDGHGLPDGWRAGVGITSMRERAGELGGTLTLTATANGGTRVLATLPIIGLAESTEQGAQRG